MIRPGTARPGRTLRRALRFGVAVPAAAALLAIGPAACAHAASPTGIPWWHLVGGAKPSLITPRPASEEVQDVTVSGSSGELFVLARLSPAEAQKIVGGEAEPKHFTVLEVGASAAAVQAGLEEEEVYGAGNVEVSGGAGGPYLITFVGSLGFEALAPINTELSPLVGFSGSVGVSEVSHGANSGELEVSATNLGEAPTAGGESIVLTDRLPAGVVALAAHGLSLGKTTPPSAGSCTVQTSQLVSCEFPGPVRPYFGVEARIKVGVPGAFAAGDSATSEASVTGGGAASVSAVGQVHFGTDPGFGAEVVEMRAEESGGEATVQAGAHPFQLTSTIRMNQTAEELSVALPKDLKVKVPPGLIGNPQATPRCSLAQFQSIDASGFEAQTRCPAETAVGVASVLVNRFGNFFGLPTYRVVVPVFNLEPGFGEPARFGLFIPEGNVPVILDTSIRSGEDYGVTVTSPNTSQAVGLLSAEVTLWGTPADPRHDFSRGYRCLEEPEGAACPQTNQPNPTPLLSMPTSCVGSLSAGLELNSWADPASFITAPAGFTPSAPLIGCNLLPFDPRLTNSTTSPTAATATGLSIDLSLDDEGLTNSRGLTESTLKKVTVALPTGVTTNPAVANGLSACSLASYEEEALGNQSCPESSKVGEVEIESPLVEPTIHGSVYVARQHDNPADNLLSIYMVAKNPELGVLVKSAGAVTLDPQTGQLSTTFDELPQLPFSHFHFAFRSGPRAPLVTPNLCGTYATQADLYPYSNPNVPVHREATFTVSSGAGGAGCVSSESQLPDDPSLEAGTVTPIAGAYSPFVFKVSRADGSQALSRIDATLPAGLLGKLAGVSECSNAQIAQAESRSGEGQGAVELASPSCPASSQVGTVDVATGVGPQPYHVQGKAYLAGPYKGAPLSLAIVTPAVVGPFDLGTIVVRTALYVDETTAQITAKSDPIPTIVHGLPTVVQSISLNMNRPNFTINPTSCEPKQVTGSATSTLGGVAPLSSRFQVGACGALGFKPGLKLSLTGQTKRAGHPAVKAVLTYPKGSYANIARAQVSLPGSEFLDQGNLNLVCKQANLKAGTCPKTSIYGKVKAWSPLLEKPLQGNVYLGVGYGYKLPALVAELNGQIRVLLVGKVDTDKQKGIRNTFLAVPDAAVSRFELSLKGGKKYGLLENSENICKKTQKAEANFTAQNGKVETLNPTIANSCGKKSKRKKSSKK